MRRKVALDEHFARPETVQDSAGVVPGDHWVELKARLLDMQDRRLREMDAHDIKMMLPAVNAPAVQAISGRKQAIEIARRAVAGRAVLPAPANPLPQHAHIHYGHHWLLDPTWAFGMETAAHALRLMASGLFLAGRSQWMQAAAGAPSYQAFLEDQHA